MTNGSERLNDLDYSIEKKAGWQADVSACQPVSLKRLRGCFQCAGFLRNYRRGTPTIVRTILRLWEEMSSPTRTPSSSVTISISVGPR